MKTKSPTVEGQLKRPEDLDVLTKRFHAAMAKGVEGIVEAGKVLIEAKDNLEYGQFTEWVVQKLRFGSPKDGSREADIRKAQMLMNLAAHDVISNASHWHALPPSIRTLYELTQIRPPQRLLKLIEKGRIHAGTTREEAITLKPKEKPKTKTHTRLAREIGTLVDVSIKLGGADCVLAYIRSKELAENNLTVEDFDRAVRWVKPKLAKQKGDE